MVGQGWWPTGLDWVVHFAWITEEGNDLQIDHALGKLLRESYVRARKLALVGK